VPAPSSSDIDLCGKLASRDLFAFGAARFSGQSSAHNVPDRRNPESRIPHLQCAMLKGWRDSAWPAALSSKPCFLSNGHSRYRFLSLSERQERLAVCARRAGTTTLRVY